jgi:hypothetical protein
MRNRRPWREAPRVTKKELHKQQSTKQKLSMMRASQRECLARFETNPPWFGVMVGVAAAIMILK